MEEDSLAIHTSVSAAYTIYSDLLRHRGKNPAFYHMAYGVLVTAKQYINGELSDTDRKILGEDGLKHLQPFIDMLREDPDINEITVRGPKIQADEFYRAKHRASNFLKHADRDPSEMLDTATINNEDLIIQTISCSLHLNCEFTSEKEYFYAAMRAFGKLENEHERQILVPIFQSLSREEIICLARRNLCYSRVDDDQDIDWEEVKVKSEHLMTDK